MPPSNSTDDRDFKSEKGSQHSTQDIPVVHSNVWRKIDLRLLPVLSIVFLLSFLERSNIGNARIAGLQKDLHASNYMFSLSLTVTYIPGMLVQLPVNLRIGANILIPSMVVLWGFASMMQAFVHNYSGLIACRFFLGLFAGGSLPVVGLYVASFYSRYTLQLRISIYCTSSAFAGAFSGLLAAAIVKMDGLGGKPGWSWILLLEGLFTISFGVLCFFVIPRSVADAKFLDAEEKAYIEHQLLEDKIMSKNPEDDRINFRDILVAFTRPNIMLLVLACFFNGTTQTGLAYFMPSIVRGLGYSANHAQLMTVPPFAVALVVCLASGYLSDRYRCRGLTIIIFTIMTLVGFVMYYTTESNSIRYGSFFLSLPGCYGGPLPISAWTINNAAPYTRRAAAIAISFIVTSAGAILSTWLLGSLSAPPDYTKAVVTFIIFAVLQLVCVVANLAYCMWQNKLKQEQRLRITEEEELRGLGDKSAYFVYSL